MLTNRRTRIIRMGAVLIMAICLYTAAPGAYAQAPVDEAGVWRHVTIYRDAWGTPHVYGDSLRTMAYGYGYAQAEDHITPMLLAYRFATGTAAAVTGPALAASDEYALRMGFDVLAEDALAEFAPGTPTRDLCEGFAAGVNAWVTDNPGAAPSWAEPVRPSHILALLHRYLLSFAPMDLPDAYHPAPGALSGNSWAIGPSASATREPMLVINPHADYTSPFQWCEAHLVAPGLDVSGATLFGLPVILQGHNGFTGWALTPNDADTADVFIDAGPAISVNPKSPASISPIQKAAMTASYYGRIRPRSYQVSGANGLETRSVECLYGNEGPLIGKFQGRYCTLRIGGYRAFGGVQQLMQMATAQTMTDFQAAIAMQQLPCFHILYADVDGNIMYLYNASTGQRIAPTPASDAEPGTAITFADWTAPLPAGSNLGWGGFLPVANLPWFTNPASGYAVACGVTPWSASPDSGLTADNWPTWLSHDRDSYRSRRISQLISMGPRSFDDMPVMLFDVASLFGFHATPKLLQIVDGSDGWLAHAHPDVAAAVGILRQWNALAGRDSEGMTVFHAWWQAFITLAPPFPSETDLMDAFLNNQINSNLSLDALGEGARFLRNTFEEIRRPWGSVHVALRGKKETPMPGGTSGDPVWFARGGAYIEGKWVVNAGYGFAMAIKFGASPQVLSILPFGASENPDSPHFSDQLDLFAEGKMKPAWFDINDVQANASVAWGAAMRLGTPGYEANCYLTAPAAIRALLAHVDTLPAALPAGTMPYASLYEARWTPEPLVVTAEYEFRIPPERCVPGQLNTLAVYSYLPGNGWTRVAEQRAHPENATLIARGSAKGVYTVLGPVSGDGSGYAVLANPNASKIVESKPGSTPPAKEMAPGQPAQPDPQAPAQPAPEQPTPQPVVPTPPPPPAPSGSLDMTQPAPGGGSLDMTQPAPQAPPPPVQQPSVVSPAPQPRTEVPVASTGMAANATPNNQAPIAWGRYTELDIPGGGGKVSASCDEIIGVRVSLPDKAKVIPPAGFAIAGGSVSLESTATKAPIAVHVRLVPGDAPELAAIRENARLYGWSEETGWYPLDNPEYDPLTRAYSGDGHGPHLFAVLYPAANPAKG